MLVKRVFVINKLANKLSLHKYFHNILKASKAKLK